MNIRGGETGPALAWRTIPHTFVAGSGSLPTVPPNTGALGFIPNTVDGLGGAIVPEDDFYITWRPAALIGGCILGGVAVPFLGGLLFEIYNADAGGALVFPLDFPAGVAVAAVGANVAVAQTLALPGLLTGDLFVVTACAGADAANVIFAAGFASAPGVGKVTTFNVSAAPYAGANEPITILVFRPSTTAGATVNLDTVNIDARVLVVKAEALHA